MTDRLILPMLDVCVACLREGVVADEDTIDGAMIFATGFAPFRGGPMHYARSRGVTNVCAELKRLAQRYGERFRPCPGWDRLMRDRRSGGDHSLPPSRLGARPPCGERCEGVDGPFEARSSFAGCALRCATLQGSDGVNAFTPNGLT